jgi:hypothetical protein
MISDLLWQRPSREEFDAWGTELGNGFDMVLGRSRAVLPQGRKLDRLTNQDSSWWRGGPGVGKELRQGWAHADQLQ